MCYPDFRVRPKNFIRLCNYLRETYDLKSTDGVSTYEVVGIFMFIVGHGIGHRAAAEIFGHSIETVHHQFHRVLNVALQMSVDIIKPTMNYNQDVQFHKLAISSSWKKCLESKIVFATMAIDNYLRRTTENNDGFARVQTDEEFKEQGTDSHFEESRAEKNTAHQATHEWENVRRIITSEIWNSNT
ncbi:Uncharacterized protein Adt_23042 [Abeliophyllum distichum]|uniref:DUF8040 domain-containing protein n=1 Tax=Abeliophyllum distichum TaxID=126358 RepID=A0ABD1S9S9_9LAMI